MKFYRGFYYGCIIALLGSVLLTSAAFSQQGAVPQLVSYQGRLLDDSGAPLTGTYDVTFTIYDSDTLSAPANKKWTEDTSISPSGGIYSVMLGKVTPLAPQVFFDTQELYLGVLIDGETAEMKPRSRIAMVGYAASSNLAANAMKLNDRTAGNSYGQIPISNGSTSYGLYAEKAGKLEWSACQLMMSQSYNPSPSVGSATAICSGNYYAASGGCQAASSQTLLGSYPQSTTAWRCEAEGMGMISAYARCCPY